MADLAWHEERLVESTTGVDIVDAITQNYSVIAVPDFASAAECEQLLAAGSAAEERGMQNPLTSDATRLRIEVVGRKMNRGQTQSLDGATQSLVETLVRRSISFVQHQLPNLADALALSKCTSATVLSYSQGEPAINIYYGPGGEFKPHQDMQALTLLLPLSTCGEDYEGGGTSFWHPDVQLPAARSGKTPPWTLLRPRAGTALLWGGTLVHAGAEVISGRRSVLVASFTPREGT